MSTATQQQPQQQTVSQTLDLLDVVIRRSEDAMKGVRAALDQVGLIEKVLPPQMKGQGQRLADRAALEFERNVDLQLCTPRSFVRAVVEAAELGLAIDGRLAHAVAFNVKVSKKGEPDKWEKHSQLIIDFKGLLVIARRTGQIRDGYGDLICANDKYVCRRVGDTTEFFHERPPLGAPRGKILGVYFLVKLPIVGEFRVEEMDTAQVDKIRDSAPGKNSPAWKNHWDQMAIKTVARRAMKTYCDDQTMSRALEIDDRELLGDMIERAVNKKVSRSPINDIPLSRPQEPQASAAPATDSHAAPPADDPAYNPGPPDGHSESESPQEHPPGGIVDGINRESIKSKFELFVPGEEAQAVALRDKWAGPESPASQEDCHYVEEIYDKTMSRLAKQTNEANRKKAKGATQKEMI